MNRCAAALRTSTALAVLGLAACGGGGGSSSPLPAAATSGTATSPVASASSTPLPSATPAPKATPTATPVMTTTSGFVYDLPYDGTSNAPGYSVVSPGVAAYPGAPIAGADVYVGPALVLGSSAPATVPAGTSHAITAANGNFSIANLVPGTYALTIFAPAPHVAVVHRDLVVAAGTAAATYYMTAPNVDESAWLAQQNVDRATFGVAPLSVDESALEAARYWSSFMARNTYFAHCVPASSCEAGDTTPLPASYGAQDATPQTRLAYFHGFSGASEGENIGAGFSTWALLDQAFMSEQVQCPGGSPTGCPFTSATGHFLNIVDAKYAWTGVAMTTAASNSTYYDEEFSLVSSTLPTRAAARLPHALIPGRRI